MTNSADSQAHRSRRMKRVVGDVLKIDFGDGTHSYAQVSTDPLIIFFDCRTSEDLSVEEVAFLPVAFRLWVHNKDIEKGNWGRIGNAPVRAELLIQPLMFKQDPISGRLAHHHNSFEATNYERDARLSECRGLECAAVWEARHVEDRLRDHFAGVENKWVRCMAIDESKVPVDQRD